VSLGAVRAAAGTAELEWSQVRMQRHEGDHEGRERDEVCAAHGHGEQMVPVRTRTYARDEL
jgi:hypothetical protein